MAFASLGRPGVQSAINMTPMIDVLLVLLIIFLIVTPMKPTGLKAEIPQPAADAAPRDELGLLITVRGGGRVSLNRDSLTVDELGQRLRSLFARRADPLVFVSGAGSLEYQEVARVIDIARGAGAFRIGLMTTAPE